MGSLTSILLIVTVIYFICIGLTPKSSVEPQSEAATSWECDTCGGDNTSDAQQCAQCGMERSA